MDYTVVLICLITFLLFFHWWWTQRCNSINHFKNFKGPPPLPIVGNALDLAVLTEILPKLMECTKKYGSVVKISIGPFTKIIIISQPKMLEFFLTSKIFVQKSMHYNYFENWLGKGILTADGGMDWKKHRTITNAAFHTKILEKYVEIFEKQSKILVKKLKKDVGKPSVHIQSNVALCTLDIICETTMGTLINAQENSESDYVRSVKEMCKILIERSFNVFLQYKYLYYLSKLYTSEKNSLKILNDYTTSVINKGREKLKNKEKKDNEEDEFGRKKKVSLLDLLLEHNVYNQNLTDKNISDEVQTFMFAGHDTTASMISFAIYCLSVHQDVQKNVIRELQDIFGNDKSSPITIGDLQNMKYLEAVIKETLRMYPPVPYYSRRIHEDVEYEGSVIPKGTTTLFFVYGLHRNPEIYPEPDVFKPERFLNENATSRNPFFYIPFSAGPRNCIGQKYAMLEGKTVLSTILRNFELLPALPEHVPILSSETVLISKNGLCVSLKEREF